MNNKELKEFIIERLIAEGDQCGEYENRDINQLIKYVESLEKIIQNEDEKHKDQCSEGYKIFLPTKHNKEFTSSDMRGAYREGWKHCRGLIKGSLITEQNNTIDYDN